MVSILVDNELLLRTYQNDDVQELFRAVDASRQHLRQWFDWVDKTTRPEHIQQFVQQSLDKMETQDGLVLGIFHKQRVIGEIGMHNWDKSVARAQIGYWIAKDYEGQGIMQKCLSRVIDFLFDKVGLNKIEIHFLPSNKRSARVAEKLGFKTEGLIRKSWLRNGMAEDIIVTGLLKKEWRSAQS